MCVCVCSHIPPLAPPVLAEVTEFLWLFVGLLVFVCGASLFFSCVLSFCRSRAWSFRIQFFFFWLRLLVFRQSGCLVVTVVFWEVARVSVCCPEHRHCHRSVGGIVFFAGCGCRCCCSCCSRSCLLVVLLGSDRHFQDCSQPTRLVSEVNLRAKT